MPVRPRAESLMPMQKLACRGNAMIECALIVPFAAMLLFGVSSIGIRLGRTIQATQLTRDVAHMYALGTDFSLPGTRSLTATLARGFDISGTGDTVLIFSRVTKVFQPDCTAAGVAGCPNLNKPVFAQRIVIGNTSLRSSAFGTPPSSYLNSQGNIRPSDYCQQSTLVASGFDSFMSLAQGQFAWLVEGYFPMPDLAFLNTGTSSGGFYVRLVF